MSSLVHPFPFDPAYDYSLEQLMKVGAPEAPADFQKFWTERYARALEVESSPTLSGNGIVSRGWNVHDLRYRSTNEIEIGGWCLVPEGGKVERAFVVLHGYGGREAPDFHLPLGDNAALIFPCARGFGRSRHPEISSDPGKHVLHGIEDRDEYIIGGCVDDVWHAVGAAEALFPMVKGRVGLLGVSFGGGVGAMALAWDERIARAHFNVPTFGNQPLRLGLETVGSGAALRELHQVKPEMVEQTLGYFDSALASRHIDVPVHFACARFDPMVAPPGQFAVHNVVPSEKELFVLSAGHFEYPEQMKETRDLLREIHGFFQAV